MGELERNEVETIANVFAFHFRLSTLDFRLPPTPGLSPFANRSVPLASSHLPLADCFSIRL